MLQGRITAKANGKVTYLISDNPVTVGLLGRIKTCGDQYRVTWKGGNTPWFFSLDATLHSAARQLDRGDVTWYIDNQFSHAQAVQAWNNRANEYGEVRA